ncbi:MAG: RNA methyltransferase [Bacteroidales bacterium]|nr:RNA methyltransferase [Bacteroidales bacterium]
MLSKSKVKIIKQLYQKKYRKKEGLFIAEGTKVFKEFFNAGWELVFAVSTEQWCKDNCFYNNNLIITNYDNIKKLSTQVTPQPIIGIFKQKKVIFNAEEYKNKWGVILADIQDPGNAGTIIRSALWFGIDYVILSENSVDLYNPKLIQASMGAIAKINVFECKNYIELIKNIKNDIPIYVAHLQGKSLNDYCNFKSYGILVVGNESKGVNKEIFKYVHDTIYIPSHKDNVFDSLNVSVSASIIFYEIMKFRKKL